MHRKQITLHRKVIALRAYMRKMSAQTPKGMVDLTGLRRVNF